MKTKEEFSARIDELKKLEAGWAHDEIGPYGEKMTEAALSQLSVICAFLEESKNPIYPILFPEQKGGFEMVWQDEGKERNTWIIRSDGRHFLIARSLGKPQRSKHLWPEEIREYLAALGAL